MEGRNALTMKGLTRCACCMCDVPTRPHTAASFEEEYSNKEIQLTRSHLHSGMRSFAGMIGRKTVALAAAAIVRLVIVAEKRARNI